MRTQPRNHEGATRAVRSVRLSAKIVGDRGVHARLVPFANFGRERRKSPHLDGHGDGRLSASHLLSVYQIPWRSIVSLDGWTSSVIENISS
jgi:hypothetical protein